MSLVRVILVGVLSIFLNVSAVHAAATVASPGPQNETACAADIDAQLQQDLLSGLVLRSAQLRTVGVLDAQRIASLFGRDEHVFPDWALYPNVDARANSVLWTYFFQTSQVFLAHLYSSQPMVAYYSAMLDVWWLTEWEYVADDYKMIRSSLWSTHPEAAVEALPPWLRQLRAGGVSQALAQQVAASVGQFQQLHPENACEVSLWPAAATDQRELFRQRAALAMLSLSEFSNSPAAALQIKLHDYLNQPAAHERFAKQYLSADFPQQVLASLKQVPQEFRQALSTSFVIDLEQRIYVISAPPTQGRYFFISEWQRENTNSLLGSLGLIDAYAGVAQ